MGHKRRSHRRSSNDESNTYSLTAKPYIMNQINKIERDAIKKKQEAVDEYLAQNNLTDLVSPYITDPVQKNLISHIIGSKNTDDMARVSALAYSGIINTTCPPPGEPWKTELYTNPLTGKTECRSPIPKRVLKDPKLADFTCPRLNDDPNAIQKYIDYYGQPQCIRPVFSGSFSCPDGDPTKTKLKVLKNNVGICVDDDLVKQKKNKRKIMPNNLIFSDDANSAISNFMNIYDNNRLTLEQIKELNGIFKNKNDLKSIRNIQAGLSSDPDYETMSIILNNINSKNDIAYARTALSTYLRNVMKNNNTEMTAKDFFNLNGIGSSMFEM